MKSYRLFTARWSEFICVLEQQQARNYDIGIYIYLAYQSMKETKPVLILRKIKPSASQSVWIYNERAEKLLIRYFNTL